MSAFELLLLERLPGVGPRTVGRLVEAFGSAEEALVAPRRLFAAVASAEAARARTDRQLRHQVRKALRRASDGGIHVVTWNDARYPAGLRPLADPPPVLFLRGRIELLGCAPAVTVVGARRSTARARAVSERLASALARAEVCVASGLALGVDGAAHVGALRAGGATVAVLGAGADVAYPRFHRRLHERIAGDGLLVTEFSPGTTAAPHHFPRRNRILAALSGTTVVVEAGRRSGSLITVDHALDLGKDVWAVPGPIDVPACAGSNRLLADGARPLVSIDDFVATLAGSVTAAPRTQGVGREGDGGQASLFDRAPPDAGALERRILEVLGAEPTAADELAARFDAPIATVLALLTTLELHGEVERVAGMRFRRAA